MKLLLFISIFFAQIGYTQDLKVSESQGAYFQSFKFDSNEIGFLSYDNTIKNSVLSIEFIKSNTNQSIVISLNDKYDKVFTHIVRKNEDSFLFVSSCSRQDSAFLVLSDFDGMQKQHILEEHYTGEFYGYFQSPKSKRFQNFDYTIIGSYQTFPHAEQYMWVKLKDDNTLDYNFIDKKSNSSSRVFSMDYVSDIEFVDENSFLLTSFFAFNHMDLDFQNIVGRAIVGFGDLAYSSSEVKRISNGSYILVTSGQILGTFTTQEILVNFEVKSDSIYFTDRTIIFENPSNEFLGNPVMDVVTDTIFTSVDYFNDPFSGIVKNTSFWVSKSYEKELIWTKEYGGDYAYSIFSIQRMEENIVVSGQVHDFYDEKQWKGFYMILDCEGNIVTSSHNIHIMPEIEIYPNPTTDYITLQSDYKQKVLFQLYNNQGQKVMSKQVKMNHTKIQLPNGLSPGSYFYKIINQEKGLLKTGQLVKE